MIIDGKNYSFTQPVCNDDYRELYPDRPTPVRIKEEFREQEICCCCGNTTTSGIYVRIDPSTVPYPQEKE